jgi:hypothetical protein
MGLMQLLTVGRSLNEPKSGPNGYKLKGGMLPKFAPVGRGISLSPFAAAPIADSRSAAQAELIFDAGQKVEEVKTTHLLLSPENIKREIEPAQVATQSPFAKAKPEISTELFAPQKPGTPASEQKEAKSSRRWSLREIFYVRKVTKKETREKAGWTLDKVTVIRNELVDSDIEIVLGRSAPEKLPRNPNGETSGKWKINSPHWRRWVTRWVRAEQTAK